MNQKNRIAKGKQAEQKLLQFLQRQKYKVFHYGIDNAKDELLQAIRAKPHGDSTTDFVRFMPDFVCLDPKGNIKMLECKASNSIEYSALMHYQFLYSSGVKIMIALYIDGLFYFVNPIVMPIIKHQGDFYKCFGDLEGIKIQLSHNKWLNPKMLSKQDRDRYYAANVGSMNKFGYIDLDKVKEMHKGFK